LNLRRITNEDPAEVFFLRSDKQMLEFLDCGPAESVDDAIPWIEMTNKAIDRAEYIA
jgi:hypothetical protein